MQEQAPLGQKAYRPFATSKDQIAKPTFPCSFIEQARLCRLNIMPLMIARMTFAFWAQVEVARVSGAWAGREAPAAQRDLTPVSLEGIPVPKIAHGMPSSPIPTTNVPWFMPCREYYREESGAVRFGESRSTAW